MIDRDVLLIIIGAIISLFSTVITSVLQHILSIRSDNKKFEREKLERNSLDIRQALINGSNEIDTVGLKRLELREKILRGEQTIIVPDHKLACFPDFTSVTLINKEHKPIKEIRVGDEILSYDIETKSLTGGIVKAVKVDNVSSYMVVNDLLHVTRSHRIFVEKDEYFALEKAENLCVNLNLITETEQKVPISSVKLVTEDTQVYNLAIEGNKPFFAGGFLVGDLITKSDSTQESQILDEDTTTKAKRKELRDRLLKGEVSPEQSLASTRIEILFPDKSVFDVEFPNSVTTKILLDELSRHFDLDPKQWSLCSKEGIVLLDDEIIYNLVGDGHKLRPTQLLVVPEGKLA